MRTQLMRAAMAALHLLGVAAPAAQAQLPAPGSSYHILFATQNLFRTTSSQGLPPAALRFGSIAGADYQVTNEAFNAGLPGTFTWDGISPIYRSILSTSGDNARDRLAVAGAVYNTHGEQLATSHADLFDGLLAAPVGYDEYGQAIAADDDPEVWTGSLSTGIHSGFSCNTWSSTSNMAGGRTGNTIDASANWLNTDGNQGCNQSARLYALSPALVAPLWGDYDGSGTVDGGDFLQWQRQLGGQPSTVEFYAARAFTVGAPSSELNVVGAADLAVWQEHFGQSYPLATAVPEPRTHGVGLVLAVAGLSAWLRRRGIHFSARIAYVGVTRPVVRCRCSRYP